MLLVACSLVSGWLVSRCNRIARRVFTPTAVLCLSVVYASLRGLPVTYAQACLSWLAFTFGRRLHCVGLTGGIGTGKSSVSRVWSHQPDVFIIVADVVAREVVQPGTPAFKAIVARFGPAVLLPSGSLDREALVRGVRRPAVDGCFHAPRPLTPNPVRVPPASCR